MVAICPCSKTVEPSSTMLLSTAEMETVSLIKICFPPHHHHIMTKNVFTNMVKTICNPVLMLHQVIALQHSIVFEV